MDPEREKGENYERSLLLSAQEGSPQRHTSRRRVVMVLFLVFAAAIVLGLGLGLGLGLRSQPSSSGTYKTAAVATDAARCSQIGVDVLKRNGSAVDAAIASLLCTGVVNLHSTGIGGGGFMVYYNASSGEASAFDYREVAPAAATIELFNNSAKDATLRGGLAVAVPGEVRGFELAHQRHGILPWKDLFEIAAQVADEGFEVSASIADAITAKQKYILSGNFPGLEKLLAPGGKLLKKGDRITRHQYAQTLRSIGEEGADFFYNSSFTKELVRELREGYNSVMTVEDLQNYTAIEREVVTSQFANLEVIGVPPPASGAVLGLILNILDGYNFTDASFGSLSYHRTVEAFKFAYGQRLRLGDPAFNETVNEVTRFMLRQSTADDMRARITDNATHDPSYYLEPLVYSPPFLHGTSHLCVIAPNGDAVAATSTINNYFGSLIRSPTSGIIFNDEMDDFSLPDRNNSFDLPPSRPNFLHPRKRPQSSMTPTIIVEGSKVKMIVGASGGSKITTAVAQVVLDVLNFDKPLRTSIPYPRLHHQLLPNIVIMERNFPEEFRNGLKQRGHVVKESDSFAVVQGIYVDKGGIHASSDPRKGGIPAGF